MGSFLCQRAESYQWKGGGGRDKSREGVGFVLQNQQFGPQSSLGV